MPRNQFQRMVFAFLTVLVTVHGYVFYSLYVVNGNTLMQINGADSVIHAINTQGGVYMFGRMVPIWAVVLIEFCFAYALECRTYYVPVNELFSSMDVLSVLWGISYFYTACKCPKADMPQFSICILFTDILYSAFREMGLWKTFCEGYRCQKFHRNAGAPAE